MFLSFLGAFLQSSTFINIQRPESDLLSSESTRMTIQSSQWSSLCSRIKVKLTKRKQKENYIQNTCFLWPKRVAIVMVKIIGFFHPRYSWEALIQQWISPRLIVWIQQVFAHSTFRLNCKNLPYLHGITVSQFEAPSIFLTRNFGQ